MATDRISPGIGHNSFLSTDAGLTNWGYNGSGKDISELASSTLPPQIENQLGFNNSLSAPNRYGNVSGILPSEEKPSNLIPKVLSPIPLIPTEHNKIINNVTESIKPEMKLITPKSIVPTINVPKNTESKESFSMPANKTALTIVILIAILIIALIFINMMCSNDKEINKIQQQMIQQNSEKDEIEGGKLDFITDVVY